MQHPELDSPDSSRRLLVLGSPYAVRPAVEFLRKDFWELRVGELSDGSRVNLTWAEVLLVVEPDISLPAVQKTISLYWDDRDQTRSIPPTGGTNANLRLNWSPLSPSVVTDVSVSPDPVEPTVGNRVSVTAHAVDQYGYGLSRSASWDTDHTYIATAGSFGGMNGWVEGESEGTTSVEADVEGIVGDATVNVTDCDPETEQCEADVVTDFTGKDMGGG